jgi:phosphoenolpyruvate-protein phosphotransferase (PTS system enzyme I)
MEAQEEEIVLKGFPICEGVAIGVPYHFAFAEERIPEFAVPKEKIEHEVKRYYSALKNSKRDLVTLQRRLKKEGGGEAVEILGAHLEMMKDPLITTEMEEEIRKVGKNTEFVFKCVAGRYEAQFQSIQDNFFRERLKDFQDISRRIIHHLRKEERPTLASLSKSSIIFAHELAPSDTAEARDEHIDAFVTRSGSETSHVAIMARAKGIPFVSKVDFPEKFLHSAKQVIVDGFEGIVVINPTEERLASYRKVRRQLKTEARGLLKEHGYEAETYDGYRVRLSANIEKFTEIPTLEKNGGEGIGLFRTEYLFLAKDGFPSESEQLKVYKQIVENVHGHPSVIRVFDIGGDKMGHLYPSAHEDNPYLGCRAIRLMLKEKNTFKTQLRAILRASAFGDVSILLPMISGLDELLSVKGVLKEAKDELTEQGIPFSRSIQLGCMIEVPSAAMICDVLARECDFLSIGTNDLVQYALAADRNNPTMSYLYNPAHPSVVRLIKMIVGEASRFETPVSVCGEIAADPLFTPLLLGLGVHELSVSVPALPRIKNRIRKISIVDAVSFAEKVLMMETDQEIERALEEMQRGLIEPFQ